MSSASTNPHNDPQLAADCYPSGSKNEATAMCVCGGIEIKLKTDEPALSVFCHCWACRRAHAAPLYQVLYSNTANICSKTGAQKDGEFEVTVTKGFELLTGGMEGPGFPNWQHYEDHPLFGGVGRLYCAKCSVIMVNAIYLRPGTDLNDGEEDAEIFGVFPGTFTEKMSEFIQSWQPAMHVNCGSSILPVASIHDGLPKLIDMPGSAAFV